MAYILEISKKASHGGRVPIKIALLKIHEEASETNNNGIHWNEKFVANAMESIKLMPICAEFCDEEKEVPLGHGLTGLTRDENGFEQPIFENSETVGVIETASIETIDRNGEQIKALCGSGYLFNQRYPNFVNWVRKNHALGSVDTSIEIIGTELNQNQIIYLEDKPTEKFRTPKEFEFSGTAILSVTPADTNAIVLEVAEKLKKEEQTKMDEKELKELIRSTISETNSKNNELSAKIAELNSLLEDKDNTIADLNESIEKLQKALDDCRKEEDAKWAEMEALRKELGELKAAARLAELETATKDFTEEEKEYAKAEINSFTENPLESNVDDVVAKIYAGIGQATKKADTQAKVAEQNAAKANDALDIFSEVNSDNSVESEDVNIF